MATLTVRGLDDDLRQKLRVRAAEHGRSMESEVRAILDDVLSATPAPARGLGSRIHARLRAAGGADLETPSRRELPRAAVFEA